MTITKSIENKTSNRLKKKTRNRNDISRHTT
ncbi:MAG: hypothetical protein ACI8RD_000520, partial [Bacillariaceae sp.]